LDGIVGIDALPLGEIPSRLWRRSIVADEEVAVSVSLL
jgi:hypothetical protein